MRERAAVRGGGAAFVTVICRFDHIREVEIALGRAPIASKRGRYAVYVPGSVVIATFEDRISAEEMATAWTVIVPEVVVVDRGKDLSERR